VGSRRELANGTRLALIDGSDNKANVVNHESPPESTFMRARSSGPNPALSTFSQFRP
jgi:hypothetical protein